MAGAAAGCLRSAARVDHFRVFQQRELQLQSLECEHFSDHPLVCISR